MVAANHQLVWLAPTLKLFGSRVAVVDSTQPGRQPETPPFNPLNMGIYARFIVREQRQSRTGGAVINTRLWNYAVASGEFVGECRKCGHEMIALATEIHGQIHWYSAECTGCRCVIAMPNGEILLRSGRWSEQPQGFLQSRKAGK